MIQTLSKNWWLLVVCGVLYAVMAAIYLRIYNAGGPLTFHAWSLTIAFSSKVALAAGACTIIAGIWRGRKDSSWFLVLHGLALVALGLLFLRANGGARISLRTILLVMMLMAISFGIVELDVARTLRHLHQLADGWVVGLAGVVSLAFVLPFVALGYWIQLEPSSNPEFLWFALYFSFSAICMLGLALRVHSLRGRLRLSSRGMQGALP